MKITDSYLKLFEIADHWSRGSTRDGHSLSREELFQEIIRAVLCGEFEDDDGKSSLWIYSIRRKKDGTDVSRPTQWNRRMLLQSMNQHLLVTVRTRGLEIPPTPRLTPPPGTSERWSELKREVDWEQIEGLRLEDFDQSFLHILEQLSIYRDDYLKWLLQREARGEDPIPHFWHGVVVGASASNPQDPSRKTHRKSESPMVSRSEKRWSDKTEKIVLAVFNDRKTKRLTTAPRLTRKKKDSESHLIARVLLDRTPPKRIAASTIAAIIKDDYQQWENEEAKRIASEQS